MIKYYMTAIALRLFSASQETRQAYRFLGNNLGQRKRVRSVIPSHYIDTAEQLVELCRRYHIIEKGDRLLEVGTGWVHWGATVLRLFYDIDCTLFDVWDNRQFAAYKHYCEQLGRVIDKVPEIESTPRAELHKRLHSILATNTFDELYRKMGFQYVVEPAGTLKQLGSESLAVILSINVLEHIDRGILPKFIRDSYRILKPGGYVIHQIDLSDHLAKYDRSVSRKNYYRYSEQVWTRWFENKVQYFNRVQRPEWSGLFSRAGFEPVMEEPLFGDIGGIKINQRYADLSKEDRDCMLLRVVYKKPHQSNSLSSPSTMLAIQHL